MSDAPKCEPPEELRGVDGWHWVGLYGHTKPAPELWDAGNQMWLGSIPCEPDHAHDSGYRYLSPALTPAEADALRAETVANRQKYGDDMHAALLEVGKWSRRAGSLDAELATLRARQAELLAALQDIISDAAVPQELYDKNGPTWTGKDGHEYADMSYVLDKCAELSEIARAAIAKATTP